LKLNSDDLNIIPSPIFIQLTLKYFQEMNNNEIMNIPVAILIFENNNGFLYKAYSPSNYLYYPDGVALDEQSEQYGQFMANVYNKITYDVQQNNNNSAHGQLREIHTRFISVPIINRGNMVYFYTYINPHCNYRPIHRHSPVFFNPNQADDYANQQPNLGYIQCSHEMV
jgi:hypothetical protein